MCNITCHSGEPGVVEGGGYAHIKVTGVMSNYRIH